MQKCPWKNTPTTNDSLKRTKEKYYVISHKRKNSLLKTWTSLLVYVYKQKRCAKYSSLISIHSCVPWNDVKTFFESYLKGYIYKGGLKLKLLWFNLRTGWYSGKHILTKHENYIWTVGRWNLQCNIVVKILTTRPEGAHDI